MKKFELRLIASDTSILNSDQKLKYISFNTDRNLKDIIENVLRDFVTKSEE